ncbi:hypothetical protein GCM10010103_77320 [Streptomyces paradoxus]
MAVTARSNRSKADQDPAQWLPPAADAHCRYPAEWVATKLRWSLTADELELAALHELARHCPPQNVPYEPASQAAPPSRPEDARSRRRASPV